MNQTKKTELYQQIQTLKNQINEYDYAYYQLANPLVSDFEYDQLVKQLEKYEALYQKIDPKIDQKTFNKNIVKGFVSSSFQKVPHSIPMLSLANAFLFEELIKFDQTIQKAIDNVSYTYILEPKIDGIGIAVRYSNGKFKCALTRGNGTIGEDVSENVKQIHNLPLTIDYKKDLEIRGEIFLFRKDFDTINRFQDENEKFLNARNTVAGSIRFLDPSIVKKRNLSVYFYHLIDHTTHDLHSQSDVFAFFEKHKIPYYKNFLIKNKIDDVISYLETIYQKDEPFLFDADGIVLKVNQFDYYDEIGYTNKFPKYALAFKFPPKIGTTKLVDILVSVGRTGKISYVGLLKPFYLSGCKITKAFLHNFEYIKKNQIYLNDEVEVLKIGGVIPQILRSKNIATNTQRIAFQKPLYCPCCHSQLVSQNNDLYCIANHCDEKNILSLVHFAKRDAMNIVGLSKQNIELFYKHHLVRNFIDFYLLKDKKDAVLNLSVTIKKKQVLKKDGSHSKENIIKRVYLEKNYEELMQKIEATKKNSMEHFLYALGIEHVGLNFARIIAKKFLSIDHLINIQTTALDNILNIGEKITNSLVKWFNDPQNLALIFKAKELQINFNYLSHNQFENYQIAKENEKYINKKICISGKFLQPRNEIKTILENVYQIQLVNNVSKNIDYLLIGQKPTDSKVKKAKELNIPILEEAFWK